MNKLNLINTTFDELREMLKAKNVIVENKFKVDTASGVEWVGIAIVNKTYYWLSVGLDKENNITYSFINHFARATEKERGCKTKSIQRIKRFIKEFDYGK